MSEILNVGGKPLRDNTITKKQYLTYSPYTSSYGHNDEVRIVIQSQDQYVLPSESYILVDVKVSRKTDASHANAAGTWTTFPAHRLFSEMRYELNNTEIDRIKIPGLTSYMKSQTATPVDVLREINQMINYDSQALTNRVYSMIIPLCSVFGFCEDYQKVLINARHELVLVRSRSNNSVYTCATDSFNIEVTKIQWKVPHIQLSDHAKYAMLKYLERKQTITVPYRSWDLYEMPSLPQTDKNIWTVKSSTQASKPRYVLFVLQTARHGLATRADMFDHCNVTDVKLYLNSECFPYENYNSNFTVGNCQDLYNAFAKIQSSYYNGTKPHNPYTYNYETFKSQPIFAFDCSRTDDSLLGGAVDIRLEINSSAQIAADTAAYCLIIYENEFEYSSFSGIVVKSV
ncbi:uncharacterized protein LOC129571557 [Sitodiplosis mosellana]|uniref:uncharacterized protein LOC129571557 n=1 Tax=Sitodiplosis mosellana TaxID=263140 RepID=UPI002444CFD2|nr:uncharacterized protein LOC129571557 [Sitodiplosis mosellana]